MSDAPTHSTTVHRRVRRLRWIAFALVIGAYIISFFHRVAPATIATDLQQAFSASATALGVLAATYFYIYTFMQIPTGVLVDTLGPRRILTLGGIIAGIGSFLFGTADTLALASLGRLLVGLGVSVTFIAMLKLNAQWFHERQFGTTTGLGILLGNIGAILGAAPLAWLLGLLSWRTVFEIVGAVTLALAAGSWWLIRDHPGAAGLPSLRELHGEEAHAAHEGHWWHGLVTVLRNRATWPSFWVNLGLAGAFFAFAGLWAVPFLRDAYGMSRAVATAHTSLLLAGFALGALSLGTLSDRIGRRRPVVIGAALVHVASWLPLLGQMPLAGGLSYALFFIMGVSAAAFTLSWACVKEVNPHALSGMATSVANTGAFLGAGILQPLVGYALDHTAAGGPGGALHASDYRVGLYVLFGSVLIGFTATLFIRETYCRYVRVP